jgi:hypothetical protein
MIAGRCGQAISLISPFDLKIFKATEAFIRKFAFSSLSSVSNVVCLLFQSATINYNQCMSKAVFSGRVVTME